MANRLAVKDPFQGSVSSQHSVTSLTIEVIEVPQQKLKRSTSQPIPRPPVPPERDANRPKPPLPPPRREWQQDKSVLESNRYMFENQMFCDVTFTFKDEKEEDNSIWAHKYMLVSRSHVFCSMVTALEDGNKNISIDNVQKDNFMEMLRYLYCEEVDLDVNNLLPILHCAKEYQISGLERRCRDYFNTNVDAENVCYLLEQDLFGAEVDLERKCLELIDASARDTLQSAAFTEVSQSTVEAIVKRDTLDNVEEIDVYKACVRWAEMECRRQIIQLTDSNIRYVLGDILNLIRFPVIKTDDIIASVIKGNLLTPEEVVDVLRHATRSPPQGTFPFPVNARTGFYKEMYMDDVTIRQRALNGERKANVIFSLSYHGNNRKSLTVKSVFLIDVHDIVIENVSLGTSQAKAIQERPGVFRDAANAEYQLLEAVFDPPASLNTGDHNIYIGFRVQGNREKQRGVPLSPAADIALPYLDTFSPLSYHEFTITPSITGTIPCFLVGFSCRIVQDKS